MKKIFAIVFAALALSVSVFAQDARQRTVNTIVSDVLAQLPCQDAATLAGEMKDIANAAPQSIEILAGMLQAPEKGANNIVEYAINGITNFACAPGNEAFKANIKKGLQNAAAAMKDPANKAFLLTQVRLLSPEAEPVVEEVIAPAKELVAQAKKLAKSDLSKDRCESLYLLDKALGAGSLANTFKALKSNDRAYRVSALDYATKYADDAFIAKLISKYKSFGNEAKVDVLNWLGDNKAAAAEGLFLNEIGKGGDIAKAAIEAAGKLGTNKAAAAIIDQLGGNCDAEALSALKSFPKGLTQEVELALANAKGQKLNSLLALAASKGMKNCANKVFELAQNNDDALKALTGVVSEADFSKLATALDKAPASKAQAFADALQASIRTLAPAAKYAKVSDAIKNATNKNRFYYALASSGTNEAVADLISAYDAGDKAALEGLKAIDNRNACKTLLKAAAQGDKPAIYSYIDLVNKYDNNIDTKCANLAKALDITNDPKVINKILDIFKYIPTSQAFQLASNYLGDKATAINAALAVKDIAAKCVDDLDAATTKSVLNKAIEAFTSRGDADDGYAAKEIKSMIDAIEEPSPIFTLSAEEKKLGYEMLFDGTNLDNWTGNTEGYRISNNNIYVTAGYGNGGNLYTKKQYRNFVFRFEFSFVRPGANNGVGVRTPQGVDAAYDGMCEVQVLDHDDPIYKDLREYQVHGSVYGVIPAKRIVHKPLGEWSCEEIRVEGNHITVTVNGEVIVDGDIKEACQGHNVAPDGSNVNPYTVDHRNHPGMFNETGYIGFLGHGAGVRFRNVRVLDLGSKDLKKKR